MKPSLFYVIGYPGSGKTTAMRSIVKDKSIIRVHDKPFKHTLYSDGTVQLGYDREVHGGTDSLSFNVQPKVVEWLPAIDTPLIIGEGDRLANDSFFKAVQEQGRKLTIVHIKVAELVALRRMKQRGSTFNPAWVRRTMTKVDNLALRWSNDVFTLNGNLEMDDVSEQLKGLLHDGTQ